jgi:molecular chaperone DnaJ
MRKSAPNTMKHAHSMNAEASVHHKAGQGLIFQTCLAAATHKIFLQTFLVAELDVDHVKDRIYKQRQRFLFANLFLGTTLDLRLATDRGQAQNISARVPVGVNDGAKIRVKGKGAAGEAGPGDLFILLTVKPHPIFSRAGENLTLNLPVTFTEATLGADIKVPTLSGEDVTVRIAPGTSNGRTLRVKGRGIAKGSTTGDLLVTIQVQVPQRVNEKAEEALKAFAEATAEEDVRSDFVKKAKI